MAKESSNEADISGDPNEKLTLALQKPSSKLRSLVVGKSKELAVSCGGISMFEYSW
jgi:hypothetical protein